MLTAFILVFLCTCMGMLLKAKGWRTRIWMQGAVVAAWFGSQILGMIGLGLYHRAFAPGEEWGFFGRLVFPILCGVAGTGYLFLLAVFLPSWEKPKGYAAREPEAMGTEYRCLGCARYFTCEVGTQARVCPLCGHEHIVKTEAR